MGWGVKIVALLPLPCTQCIEEGGRRSWQTSQLQSRPASFRARGPGPLRHLRWWPERSQEGPPGAC